MKKIINTLSLVSILSLLLTPFGVNNIVDAVEDTTIRVSISSEGVEGNSNSIHYSSNRTISSDGRYIVFESEADNLVPDDTNGVLDVFLYDTEEETIERITPAKGEMSHPSFRPAISSNGNYITFLCDLGEGNSYYFLYDRTLGEEEIIATDIFEFTSDFSDMSKYFSSVSNNGDVVFSRTFISFIVLGGSGFPSIFYWNNTDKELTEIISYEAGENLFIPFAASVTDDGSEVVYIMADLTDPLMEGQLTVFGVETETEEQIALDLPLIGEQWSASLRPSISGNGRYVASVSEVLELAGEEGDEDILLKKIFLSVYDREDETTIKEEFVDSTYILDFINADFPEMATTSALSANTSVSNDGRYATVSSMGFWYTEVPFSSGEFSFFPIQVLDTENEEIEGISQVTDSFEEGGYTFYSYGDGSAYISGNGEKITFTSINDGLVDGDTNDSWDVFVMDNPLQEEESQPSSPSRRSSVRSSGSSASSQYVNLINMGKYQEAELLRLRLPNANIPVIRPNIIPVFNQDGYLNQRTLELTNPRMTGPDVSSLQLYLNSKGYYFGYLDGVFGQNTQNAVMEFQKANGLDIDGRVGPETKALMK